MKKIILTLFTFACVLPVFAQVTSGKVTYKETIKIGLALEEHEEAAQFAAMLPKEQSFQKILTFTPEASLYQPDAKPADKPADQNPMSVIINMAMPQEKTYHDIKAGKTISQKEFMSRKFLVTGDAKKTTWKMTGQQKKILGYPCMQAVTTKDSEQVVVWYTPAIPVSTGPMEANGLPGLVLGIEVGKLYSLEAVKLEPGNIDKKDIQKPTEGKKVTNEEYEKIVMEKTKEMAESMDGGRNVIIRTQTR
jgi:GLPGLI family protein